MNPRAFWGVWIRGALRGDVESVGLTFRSGSDGQSEKSLRRSLINTASALANGVTQLRLPCGAELVVVRLPGRPVVALEIRLFAGYAFEDDHYLGVAHLTEETISKGTAQRDGRALNDAFDEIGATHASFTGRETVGFSSLCLPEFLSRVIELHAEMVCTPSFPDDACEVAVELAQQSLNALRDDPGELAKKLLYAQAYGQPLGRHPLGEAETLERTGREQIVAHWKQFYQPGRMHVVVAGDVDASAVAEQVEAAFSKLGCEAASGGKTSAACSGAGCEVASGETRPAVFPVQFAPQYCHHNKELEQAHIGLCFPGAAATDSDYPTEKVVVGVLAGGMSGRLFAEVREKQGLVYWVGAWSDQPRGSGIVHLGASATPANLDKTYSTLLREISRLGEDVTQNEVDRAIAGLVTRVRTRGDVTRAKAAEAAEDLFHYGHVIPTEDKLAKIQAVKVADVCEYLRAHPRDRLSVLTLGPRKLNVGT